MIDETTIAQVFAKAPPYTEAERALVVQKFRESREQFVTQGKVTKEKKAKEPKAKGVALSIDDLEL